MLLNNNDNMQKPLISIGIPFYNSEKYLEFAIKSVLAQTYGNWELFLIDDGSKDKSLEIAEYYEKKDKRLTVISDGQNKGLPFRLNELSTLANGEYYCRMDADDIMFNERLEIQKNYLIANPEIDLIGSGLISIDNNNEVIGIRRGVHNKRVLLDDLFYGTWCVHPTVMGKSTWFKSNKYDINVKRAQDYDLWIRTVENSYFLKLETPLLYYREASTSTIKKYFTAVNHSLKIYWKNFKIIGFISSIKMSILSILKLILYFLYWVFGNTDTLIERRSVKLDIKKYDYYQANINKIVL